MADRDQIFSTKLVEAVKKRPCLFNYTLLDYSKKTVVEKAWEDVALEVEASVVVCKDKWRNIRTVFGRNLKPGRIGGKRKKPYYLNDLLQFLIPFVKPSLTNVEGGWPHETPDGGRITPCGDDKEELDETYEEDVKPMSWEPDCTLAIPSSITYQTSTSTSSQTTLTSIRCLPAAVGVESDEGFNSRYSNSKDDGTACSARKHFLLSLEPDVESMSDQQFRLFRKKVVPLIDEILDSLPSCAASHTPTAVSLSNE